MNKNKILKILNNRHKAFLDSIDNPDIREIVHKNTIVTGGCIASMLLDDYPNDFDYYFTNKESVGAVADYYVKKFISLNPKIKDSRRMMRDPEVIITEDRVRIKIKSAGVVGENTNGVDYEYFEDRPESEGENFIDKAISDINEADTIDASALETLNPENIPYRPLYLTDNAITLADKVQLIIRFYGNAKEIHSNFDFIHCHNYWTPCTNKLKLNTKAMESLLTRELKYTGSKFPLCSVIRLRKFIKRGWNINAGEILKMCFQISEMDLSNIETLENQLVGVDTAYFNQLIDSLKNNIKDYPEFKISQCYVASLVDRIFN